MCVCVCVCVCVWERETETERERERYDTFKIGIIVSKFLLRLEKDPPPSVTSAKTCKRNKNVSGEMLNGVQEVTYLEEPG